MHHYSIKAHARDLSKKPSTLRKEGFVPAVLFGQGMESEVLCFSFLEFQKCWKEGHHIVELEYNGQKHLASIEEVQKEVTGSKYLHVSLHKLKRGEKTSVNLPIVLVGEPVGAKAGGVLGHPVAEITVTGNAEHLPEHVEVDVTGLELSGHIYLKDVTPPAGCSFDTHDLEKVIATCNPPKKYEEKVVEEKVETEEVTATETDETKDAA